MAEFRSTELLIANMQWTTRISSRDMFQVMEKIVKTIGKPRNYGPTEEERLELERIAMEKKIKKEALEKLEQQRKEEEERKETQRRKEEWVGEITCNLRTLSAYVGSCSF